MAMLMRMLMKMSMWMLMSALVAMRMIVFARIFVLMPLRNLDLEQTSGYRAFFGGDHIQGIRFRELQLSQAIS
jgi:hypothetical protein